MGGASAQSAGTRRNGSAQSHQNWKETEKGLEENGHKSLLCWRWLHPETSEVRAFHQADGRHKPHLKVCKCCIKGQR